MANNNLLKGKLIPPAVRNFGYLSLSLLGLIIISVIVVKVGLAKIKKQRQDITFLQKTIKVLEQKQLILSEVGQGVVKQAGLLNNALPAKNSSLTTISQIKKLANEELLVIDNLKASAEIKMPTFSRANVSFDIEGEMPAIISFLKNIGKMAPIINLDKVRIGQSLALVKASVSVKCYWVAYPTKLPAISDPIKDFNKEEEDTIIRISSLIQPEFVEVSPQQNLGRQNPFE